MEIAIKEVEISKLAVKPGDVLVVKTSGPEFASPDTLHSFQNALKQVFPNNKVLVLFLDNENKVDFTVATQDNEVKESTEGGSSEPIKK